MNTARKRLLHKRAVARKWQRENKERVKRNQKRWHRKNPEYARKKWKEWIKNNKERRRQLWKKQLAAKIAFLKKLKKQGCCKKCGIKDFRVLDWAHKKAGTKRRSVAACHSWKDILDEIKICILLCANCHRIKDYREARRRAMAQKVK